MTKRARRAVIACFVMLSLPAGCNRSTFQRAASKNWETRTFKAEGLSLDVPAASDIDHHPSFGVSVKLHPLKPAWFRLEDTQYFLTVHAERKSARALHEERESLSQDVQHTRENDFQFWSAGEHPEIDARRDTVYSYYRYDVNCGRGDIVRLTAELRHPTSNGSAKFEAEDDAIVRRILSSARCVGR